MKSHQIVLLAGLCLSAFTFTSCEKEDILPAPVIQGPGKPTTPTPTQPTPTTPVPPVTNNSLVKQFGTQVFKYDAQNRLVEVSYTDQMTHGYTIEYQGDKPVKLNFKAGGNYMLFTYAGDKVVEAIRYYGENLINYHYKFEYSGDKLVKQTETSYATSNEGRISYTDYKYDANGNLIELVNSWPTSSNKSIFKWGNYDNKPNPLPYAQSAYFLPGVKLFVNNPGYRDAGSGKELYSYAYHESGMPIERSTKLEAYPWVQPFLDRYLY